MVFALIPAGGQSVRMGRPKLALPLGKRSILEHVVAAVRQAGVEHILVVIGRHVPELVPLAEKAGADVLLLAEETPDMRATVKQGLRWLEARFHPSESDAWLLVPADHPTLNANVVLQILHARETHPACSIVIPTYRGKRGHPALIGWQHVAGIRSLSPGQGLNVHLRQQAAQTLELPVGSAEILNDLDTPDDYQRLLQSCHEEVPEP